MQPPSQFDEESVSMDAGGYLRYRNNEYVHRRIVENYYGIKLTKKQVVHHIDRNKTNNAIENLMVLENQAEHVRQHAKEDIERAGGHYTTHYICGMCKVLKPLTEFNKDKSAWNGHDNDCRLCKYEYKKSRGLNRCTNLPRSNLQQQYRRNKRPISWIK